MKNSIALIAATLWLVSGSNIPAATAADEPPVDQLSVSANTTLSDALTWSAETGTTDSVNILDHEGTFNTVAAGSEVGLLSTNASSSADNVGAALATADEVALAWDFEGTDQVSIAIDGEPLGVEDSEGSMTLFGGNITEDSEVTFTQIDQATDEDELSTFATVSLPLAQPTQSTLFAATQTLAAATVSPPAATVLRYQTFIKDAYVKAPISGCNSLALQTQFDAPFYKGNNRSYSAGTSNNKTALQLNLQWDTPTATNRNRNVSPTDVYLFHTLTGTMEYQYNFLASREGMDATWGTFYSNSVYIHLQHDIGNPDCPLATDIYYDIRGKVYRSGGYDLAGEFRQAPWHELYIKDSNNTTWQIIYRSDINSFYEFSCFVPSAPGFDYCITRDSWDAAYRPWYHPDFFGPGA